MAKIRLDFSKVPSDLALFLAEHERTEDLARSLAAALDLDHIDAGLLRDELVGSVAATIDRYTPR